jgi:tellurite resistance protein TehA-like permease
MKLDVRLPMGLLFLILGLLLCGYGVTANPAIYEKSLGQNVNVVWGAIFGAFGITMLLLALRAARAAKPPTPPKR